MTSSTTARNPLALVRASLKSNPGRTVWTALERSGLTRDEAQAVCNALCAVKGHAPYLSGRAALSVVDQAMAPRAARVPSPALDLRAEACELGEWAQDELAAAYAVLHADRDAEALAAQASEPAADEANVGSPLWDLVGSLDQALVHGYPLAASRPVVLLWLLDREQEVHALRSLVEQLARRQGEGDVEVIAARGALGGAARLLRSRVRGLGHPASTARIERRLAAVAA